jgi:hypothetical protein
MRIARLGKTRSGGYMSKGMAMVLLWLIVIIAIGVAQPEYAVGVTLPLVLSTLVVLFGMLVVALNHVVGLMKESAQLMTELAKQGDAHSRAIRQLKLEIGQLKQGSGQPNSESVLKT